ncbi:MAG: molybdopterin converting factor subunit 1 [Alcanivorax sp.]|nr:molybdopterin converting factor subunit 1 [Alcanivorax sp.]
MIEVKLFAALRERAGRDSVTVSPPPSVTSVFQLLDWLAGQDAQLAAALAATPRLMIAVNEMLASEDASLAEGDVVALFPPVTGG